MEVWTDVLAVEALAAKDRAVIRVDGKQILVLRTPKGLVACNNRCPHEGYPLSEGTLDEACVLTCNWHAWRFDLIGGQTLVGGDTLRRYPLKVEGGRIWLDLAEPSADSRR